MAASEASLARFPRQMHEFDSALELLFANPEIRDRHHHIRRESVKRQRRPEKFA
jgi:hypothetical protein